MKETKKHAIYKVIHCQSEKAGCRNLVSPTYRTAFLIAAVQFYPCLSIIKIHTLKNCGYHLPGLSDSSNILDSRFSIPYITSEGHSEHTILKYGHENSTPRKLSERREPLWCYLTFTFCLFKANRIQELVYWIKNIFLFISITILCLNQIIKFVVNTGSITV